MQIALGAGFRHHVINILPHVAGAVLVGGFVMYAASAVMTQYPEHKALHRASIALLGVTTFQVFLGIAAYGSRLASAGSLTPPTSTIWYTVLHVAVGGLTLATSILWAIQIRRNVTPMTEMSRR